MTRPNFTSWSYALDTLLEPLLWMVDSFAKILGPLFVCGVFFMTTSCIAIVYWIGLPYYWSHKGPWVTVPLIALGQYIKINIAYHYWKAYSIHPGRVPTQTPKCSTNGNTVFHNSRLNEEDPDQDEKKYQSMASSLLQKLPPITCAPEYGTLKQVTSICKKCIGIRQVLFVLTIHRFSNMLCTQPPRVTAI